MSSAIVREPVGENTDILRLWATNNQSFLTRLQQQVTRAQTETQGDTITLIADINSKKAATTLQEEKYWIKATIPDPNSDGLYLYIGCSNCGRRGDVSKGTTYKCTKCNQPKVTGVPRAAFTFEAVDSSGKRKFTIFSKNVETLFQQTTEELHDLYYAVYSFSYTAGKLV